jgi:tryptophan synthase alpha chain
MNRIRDLFQGLKKRGEAAFIPYVTPEFPIKGSTIPLLRSLAQAGVSLIEVGIPFSDPLADGRIIQHASEVSIKNGTTIVTIFDFIHEFRKEFSVPIVLMGYYNPILNYGIDAFCRDAVNAGIDGVIVPDLPPEEAGELKKYCTLHGLSIIFLIAPTSTNDRIRMIDSLSTDFIYCISIAGVTGTQTGFGEKTEFESFLRRVKQNTEKPFVVGFGISTRAHVKNITAIADGVVVGSALLHAIREEQSHERIAQSAVQFISTLR